MVQKINKFGFKYIFIFLLIIMIALVWLWTRPGLHHQGCLSYLSRIRLAVGDLGVGVDEDAAHIDVAIFICAGGCHCSAVDMPLGVEYWLTGGLLNAAI